MLTSPRLVLHTYVRCKTLGKALSILVRRLSHCITAVLQMNSRDVGTLQIFSRKIKSDSGEKHTLVNLVKSMYENIMDIHSLKLM